MALGPLPPVQVRLDSQAASWASDPNGLPGMAAGRPCRLGVSGVPFFLVGLEGSQKRFAVEGAQPAENFRQVFVRLVQEAEAQAGPPATGGGAAGCGRDGGPC
jgi:hypothetical protein